MRDALCLSFVPSSSQTNKKFVQIQLKILEKKHKLEKTFLKNLSHISSRTRLIKNIFEDMHAQKMGKFNL